MYSVHSYSVPKVRGADFIKKQEQEGRNLMESPKDKMAAGLLGIFLGSLGIHKFYLGYKKEAIIMLVVSLATCGAGATVMSIIGLIEGIMYLTKSDEEFQEIYVQGYKGWF